MSVLNCRTWSVLPHTSTLILRHSSFAPVCFISIVISQHSPCRRFFLTLSLSLSLTPFISTAVHDFILVSVTATAHCQSASPKFEVEINGGIHPAAVAPRGWWVVVSSGTRGVVDPRGAGQSAFIEIRTDTCRVVVRRTWHGSRSLFIFLMALVNILLLT